MESRREEASMLQDAEWIIGLAFLMDITGKQKHLNYEPKGEGKTTRDAEEFIFLSFHVWQERSIQKCHQKKRENVMHVRRPASANLQSLSFVRHLNYNEIY